MRLWPSFLKHQNDDLGLTIRAEKVLEPIRILMNFSLKLIVLIDQSVVLGKLTFWLV